MARFLTPLINETLPDSRFFKIHVPFTIVDIKCLKKAGLQDRITVPIGFIHDKESVPIVKGTSERGGVAHDYMCRSDSMPVVSKKLAADVYKEVMVASAKEKKKNIFSRFNRWARKWIKWGVVMVYPGYFHKKKVMATYKEFCG